MSYLQSKYNNDTKYYKFIVVIPNKIIEKLGWKGGEELNADLKNKKLIIQKEDWED